MKFSRHIKILMTALLLTVVLLCGAACAAREPEAKTDIASLFEAVPENHPVSVSVDAERSVFINGCSLSDELSCWANDGAYVNAPENEDGKASRLFTLHFFKGELDADENATIVGLLISAGKDPNTGAYAVDEIAVETLQQRDVKVSAVQTFLHGRIATVILYQDDELLQSLSYRVDDEGNLSLFQWGNKVQTAEEAKAQWRDAD